MTAAPAEPRPGRWTTSRDAAPRARRAPARAPASALDADEVRAAGRAPGPRAALGRGWCSSTSLWSEHCSYKSTRHLLKRPADRRRRRWCSAPARTPASVRAAARRGDGRGCSCWRTRATTTRARCVPVEGAATGIGGIVRDVVLHGRRGGRRARRAALRRPGGATAVRARDDRCAAWCSGIADYGNALGVPNLGGDVVFDAGFDANCLVNVVAVGVVGRPTACCARACPTARATVGVRAGRQADRRDRASAAPRSPRACSTTSRPARRGAAARSVPQAGARRRQRTRCSSAREPRAGRSGSRTSAPGGIACATSELAAAGGCGADIVPRRRAPRGRRCRPRCCSAPRRRSASAGSVPGRSRDEVLRDLQRARSRSATSTPAPARA